MCYTYDSLNRVIKRQVVSLDCDCVESEENYNYDAAGNITEGDKRTVPLSLTKHVASAVTNAIIDALNWLFG